MERIMRTSKAIFTKRDLDYQSSINYDEIDIMKTPEENLITIFKDYYNTKKSQSISNINIIYSLLMKMKNFSEFVLINDFGTDLIMDMLKEGIIKRYKKDEIIYKRETYPEYYYLVLVGNVSYLNAQEISVHPGRFFGDEINHQIKYKRTAISTSSDTILLLISKGTITKKISDKILMAQEKIQKCVENSFPVYKTLDRSVLINDCQKMIKLFPNIDDTIISTEERADSIFIIYKGCCSLNTDKKGDLMILEKGDIIGSESLVNMDEKGNILDYKYLYNLINRAQNTIIFKFLINEFHQIVIKELKIQLPAYFLKRDHILQKNEINQKLMKNRLIKKYQIFQKKDTMNEKLIKSLIKKFTPEKAENCFKKVLKRIREKENNKNDTQKFVLKKISLYKDKIKENNIFNKFGCYKSHTNIRDNKTKKVIRRYDSLRQLIQKGKIDKKELISSFKIIPDNAENKKDDITRFENNISKRRESANSIKNKLSTDNSNNNSFFFTALNEDKKLYKNIKILGKSKEGIRFSNKLRKQSVSEESFQKKIVSLLPSTERNSFSLRSISRIMSAKKQIETYGCTALDTVNYFNFGNKEIQLLNDKGEKNKRCLFYKTLKFNLPLIVFCNKKEKE